MLEYIAIGVSGLAVIVGMILIFAFIATKNAIIDIVSSFETQNSNSYEIRLKIFNRAVNFLSNLEDKNIDINTKKRELGEIFDSLLMVSTLKETLSVFESIVNDYFTNEVVMEKKLRKFKACTRKEFGAKKYNAKSVYKYSIASGKMGAFDERPPMPPRPEGMPNGARIPMPPKAPVQNGNTMNTGATFVTTKTQNEGMPMPPNNPGVKPPMPNGAPNGMSNNPNMARPMPNGMPNNPNMPRPMPNGMVPPPPRPQNEQTIPANIIMPKNTDNNKK